MSQKIFLENGSGEKLAVLKESPEGDNLPAVIIAHGFGADKSSGGVFDELSEVLVNQGIAVYRFDFSGHGESEGLRSESFLTKQIGELGKILEFVKSKKEIDSSRVGIFGFSLGSAMAVGLKPEVKSLVLGGAFYNPYEVLTGMFEGLYDPETGVRFFDGFEMQEFGKDYFEDLKKVDLLECVKEIVCPTLFIYGGNDPIVSNSQNQTLYELANEPKKRVIIDGGDHVFYPFMEKFYKEVGNWFEETL